MPGALKVGIEMSIKQLYGYFFYTLYRIWFRIDKAFGTTGPFPTKMKAMVCMSAIEVWVVFSGALYVGYFFNINARTSVFSFTGIVILIILFMTKWFVFEKNDRWKNYVREFNQWQTEKNRLGAWVVFVLILFIIFNFIYSLYLNPSPDGLK